MCGLPKQTLVATANGSGIVANFQNRSPVCGSFWVLAPKLCKRSPTFDDHYPMVERGPNMFFFFFLRIADQVQEVYETLRETLGVQQRCPSSFASFSDIYSSIGHAAWEPCDSVALVPGKHQLHANCQVRSSGCQVATNHWWIKEMNTSHK